MSNIRTAIAQAINDSVLTHTGRSVGDLAGEMVAADVLATIKEHVPAAKRVKVPYDLVELQKAYENGYNQYRSEVLALLEGES